MNIAQYSAGKNKSVPKRYVPTHLTNKDKIKQKKAIIKSQKAYKKGKYVLRKKVNSFKNKQSPHITKAQKLYTIDVIKPSKQLAEKTKCNIKGLRKIFKKGQGAYYSSGSRPNQTPHSWGYARLASSITGGKAASVDYNILQEHCSKTSKALKLANESMKKYKKGLKRVPQVSLNVSRSKTRHQKAKVGAGRGSSTQKKTRAPLTRLAKLAPFIAAASLSNPQQASANLDIRNIDPYDPYQPWSSTIWENSLTPHSPGKTNRHLNPDVLIDWQQGQEQGPLSSWDSMPIERINADERRKERELIFDTMEIIFARRDEDYPKLSKLIDRVKKQYKFANRLAWNWEPTQNQLALATELGTPLTLSDDELRAVTKKWSETTDYLANGIVKKAFEPNDKRKTKLPSLAAVVESIEDGKIIPWEPYLGL